MKDPKAILQELQAGGKAFGKALPEVVGAFMTKLKPAAMHDGALSKKQKELMALGIAIHARCDYCIVYHTHECLKAGATREEMLETCGVAVQMGGGPAMAYAGFAARCIAELAAEG